MEVVDHVLVPLQTQDLSVMTALHSCVQFSHNSQGVAAGVQPFVVMGLQKPFLRLVEENLKPSGGGVCKGEIPWKC